MEDTTTTGGSLLEAIEKAEAEGLVVVQTLTVVDREEGATERLAEAGYHLEALVRRGDPGGLMLPQLLCKKAHQTRRKQLMGRLKSPVLLMGTGWVSRNLPMNTAFRQDSNMLYFTGCDLPNAAALIDQDGCTLFLPLPAEDDALWHGCYRVQMSSKSISAWNNSERPRA